MNKQLAITALTLTLAPALVASPVGAKSGTNSAANSPIKKPIARLKPLHGSGSHSPLVPNAGWAFSPIGGHRAIKTGSPITTNSSPTGKKTHHVPSLTAYNSAPSAITATSLPVIATATASGYTARPTTAAAAAPTDLDTLPAASSLSSLEAQVKMLTLSNEQLAEENNKLKAMVLSQDNRLEKLSTDFVAAMAQLAAANRREAERAAKKAKRNLQIAAAQTSAAASAVFQPITPVLVKDD